MKLSISKNASEILNDLLNINNYRIVDYEMAAIKTGEVDLKEIFGVMARESRINATELTRKIKQSGGNTIAQIGTFAGTIYRACRDVRAKFTGSGRQSMLNACGAGDDAACVAYSDAVLSDELSNDERQLVRNQQAGLNASLDIIKKFKGGYQSILN